MAHIPAIIAPLFATPALAKVASLFGPLPRQHVIKARFTDDGPIG